MGDQFEFVLLGEERALGLGTLEVKSQWRKSTDIAQASETPASTDLNVEIHGRAGVVILQLAR